MLSFNIELSHPGRSFLADTNRGGYWPLPSSVYEYRMTLQNKK